MSENIRKNFRIYNKIKKILITFYSKNQAVNVVLLKTKATVKLVCTKWRILGICCIFLYFQHQIRALFIDFETHVFIRFLISIKFSIIISHKKRWGRKSSSASFQCGEYAKGTNSLFFFCDLTRFASGSFAH